MRGYEEFEPGPIAVLAELLKELKLDEKTLKTLRIVKRGKDPYNQNTIKGDKPIAGNSVFLVLTATLDALSELRRVPLPSGVSAEQPDRLEFFGDGDLAFTSPRASLSLELFKGQTSFRPKTWALKVTGAGNLNHLRAQERNVVDVDPREGTHAHQAPLLARGGFWRAEARLDTKPQREAFYIAMEPVGRLGEPQEIAEAVVWLCSDAASFVNGPLHGRGRRPGGPVAAAEGGVT